MFSKSKINDPIDETHGDEESASGLASRLSSGGAPAPRSAKPAPSIISSDLVIRGNLETTGDMQIEGTVVGDIRSHLLTIGQKAKVEGEIVADDVVVNGHVVGRIRGQKVRLSASARVEGDIVHKNIAIESGATFEGSVQRSEDPISQGGAAKRPMTSPAPSPSPAPAPSTVATLTIGDSDTTTPKAS